MNDIASQQEEESEPRSSIVSFPDRYLIPYIEWCKRSKRITCGCSLMFIGLAIFCFFATNYIINYPVTESRKIAFVFAGVFCIIAAISCLDLRFRILNQCGNEPSNNTLFEIARRDDTAFSDSFSRNFEMETPVDHGTPKDGPSQSETLDELSNVAHSDNESFRIHFSTFKYIDSNRLPRHSVSEGRSQAIPLLPLRRSVELSMAENSMGPSQSQIDVTVPGDNKYTPNYSTFETSQLVLFEPEFKNGWKASETEPLLAETPIEDAFEATETDYLLTEPLNENAYEAAKTEHLLASFENGCDVSVKEPRLAEPSLENGHEESETKPLLTESSN